MADAASNVEDLDTVLSAAVLLHDNGQSTDMTLIAVNRLSRGLGLNSILIPSWTSMVVIGNGPAAPTRVSAASPVGVNMRRVSAAMRAIDHAEDGRLDRRIVRDALADAASQGSSSTLAFTIACATGAAALSVVFGVNDFRTIVLIAVSAALGGLLRRLLGRFGIGVLAQAFTAALVAGLGGALAAHLGLGEAAGLAAVCPAMVLVPGPHILNGAMDLLALRMTLGITRLGYAALLLAAIAAGLVVGLRLGGQALALVSPDVRVALCADVLGRRVLPRLLLHAVPDDRLARRCGNGRARNALVVDHRLARQPGRRRLGVVLGRRHRPRPIAYLLRIPFAAIGFAAVVALVPGMYVFQMLAGLVQLTSNASPALLTASASNGTVAALVVTGMAIGLAVPNHIRNAVLAARAQR